MTTKEKQHIRLIRAYEQYRALLHRASSSFFECTLVKLEDAMCMCEDAFYCKDMEALYINLYSYVQLWKHVKNHRHGAYCHADWRAL